MTPFRVAGLTGAALTFAVVGAAASDGALRTRATATMAAASSAGSRSSLALPLWPAPTFRPAAGWFTASTGPTLGAGYAPSAWAMPLRALDALPIGGFGPLARLPRGGVAILVTVNGRGGPGGDVIPATLPLRLGDLRLQRIWEGQPSRRIQVRLRFISLRGWRLAVYVWFGSQRPSARLRGRAQAELDRLVAPQAANGAGAL